MANHLLGETQICFQFLLDFDYYDVGLSGIGAGIFLLLLLQHNVDSYLVVNLYNNVLLFQLSPFLAESIHKDSCETQYQIHSP